MTSSAPNTLGLLPKPSLLNTMSPLAATISAGLLSPPLSPQTSKRSNKIWRNTIITLFITAYVVVPITVIFGLFRQPEWSSLIHNHPTPLLLCTPMPVAAIVYCKSCRQYALTMLGWMFCCMILLKYTVDHVWLPSARVDLSGKVCVVTGGNTGIGFALGKAFAKRGAHVVLTCRTVQKCQVALDQIQKLSTASSFALELSSLESAYQLTQDLTARYPVIHYLFNNAGSTPIHNLTMEGLEDGFGGMHLAHFAVTLGLLPSLQRAPQSRVVFVASEMAITSAVGVFGPEPFGVDFNVGDGEGDLRGEITRAEDGHTSSTWSGLKAYGRAKLCNVLTALELNRRLQAKNATVIAHALHPGAVLTQSARVALTNMFRGYHVPGLAMLVNRVYLPLSWRSPRQAAHALLFAALSEKPDSLKEGGQYLDSLCIPFSPATQRPAQYVTLKLWGNHNITVNKNSQQALWAADEKWSTRLWHVSLSLLQNSPAKELVQLAP